MAAGTKAAKKAGRRRPAGNEENGGEGNTTSVESSDVHTVLTTGDNMSVQYAHALNEASLTELQQAIDAMEAKPTGNAERIASCKFVLKKRKAEIEKETESVPSTIIDWLTKTPITDPNFKSAVGRASDEELQQAFDKMAQDTKGGHAGRVNAIAIEQKRRRIMEKKKPTTVPTDKPDGEQAIIRVDQMVNDFRGKPSPSFVANIKAIGQLQEVVLIDLGDDKYEIVEGRRRHRAFEQLGIEEARAVVFPVGTSPAWAKAAALSANQMRSDNVITDMESIEAMIGNGATEAGIAKELGVPLVVVRKRIQLLKLIPELRDALGEGKMNHTSALRLSKLDKKSQKKALAPLKENNRITVEDVNGIVPPSGKLVGKKSSALSGIEHKWTASLASAEEIETLVGESLSKAGSKALTALLTELRDEAKTETSESSE